MKISCDISILARRRYKGNPRHCPIMTESGSLGLKKLEVNNNTSTKALKEQALQSSFSYIREKGKKEYAKLCSLHNLER